MNSNSDSNAKLRTKDPYSFFLSVAVVVECLKKMVVLFMTPEMLKLAALQVVGFTKRGCNRYTWNRVPEYTARGQWQVQVVIHLPRFTGANSLSKTILLRNPTQHWFKYTPLHAFSNMSLLLPFIIQFPFDHSFANDKIFLQSPLDMVDLDSDAVDIAQRLGRLSHFLSGAKGLLTCSFLSPNEFRRYSRKVSWPLPSVIVVPQWTDVYMLISCGQ